MIELNVYPEGSIIYINFNYQGIPEFLSIVNIEIREKPSDIDSSNQKEIEFDINKE